MQTTGTSADKRRELYASAPWILYGAILGLLKLVYSFLPLFNLIDVIIFGLTGGFIRHRYRSGYYLRIVLAVLPPLIITGWILSNLGLDDVASGVGTGWAASALLIPSSAVVGKLLGARMRSTEEAK